MGSSGRVLCPPSWSLQPRQGLPRPKRACWPTNCPLRSLGPWLRTPRRGLAGGAGRRPACQVRSSETTPPRSFQPLQLNPSAPGSGRAGTLVARGRLTATMWPSCHRLLKPQARPQAQQASDPSATLPHPPDQTPGQESGQRPPPPQFSNPPGAPGLVLRASSPPKTPFPPAPPCLLASHLQPRPPAPTLRRPLPALRPLTHGPPPVRCPVTLPVVARVGARHTGDRRRQEAPDSNQTAHRKALSGDARPQTLQVIDYVVFSPRHTQKKKRLGEKGNCILKYINEILVAGVHVFSEAEHGGAGSGHSRPHRRSSPAGRAMQTSFSFPGNSRSCGAPRGA